MLLCEKQGGTVVTVALQPSNVSPNEEHKRSRKTLLACLHDQHKSGLFGWPAFIQPIRAI